MKNLKAQTTILAIIFIAVVSAALTGYLFLQNRDLKSQLVSNNGAASTPIPTKPEVNPSTPTQPTATTIDETAGWKTYSDSQLGFSFKYPESGSVQKNASRDKLLIGGASFTLNYNDNKFRPQSSEIFVNVYKVNGSDLASWLMENSTDKPFGSDVQREFYGYADLGEYELSGVSGVRFKNEVMGFTANNVAVKKGNFIYVFGNIKVDADLSKEFNQIVSTFKFL